jgi:acetylornithine deacetylase/succinyl-diaminopimelate desuccinylase-like protein
MFTISPVELLQNLIRFDTTNPPGNEVECIKYIDKLLTEAGYQTTLLAKTANRPNLITRLKGQGTAPPLLLYGHVDVVTTANQKWTHPPFAGEIVDGWIWGRGALDMKSGVAMMLTSMLRAKAEDLIPAGDVVLAMLCDEETAGDYGATFLVENHAEHFQGIRYALGEFGGFTLYMGKRRFYAIQVAEKQICWIKACVRGEGGHGSMPVRGGAMAKLAQLLQQLEEHPLPVHITPVARDMIDTMASALPFPSGYVLRRLLNPRLANSVLKLLGESGKVLEPLLRHTVNATIVHASEKINVIPTEIELEIDGRLLPGYSPEDMMAELRQVIGDEVELELLLYYPCPGEPDMGLFDTLSGILRERDPEGVPLPLLLPATTDAKFFSRLGIQTYGFTPMVLPEDFSFTRTIHSADERIPIEALDFGTEAIYEVLQRFGNE